MNFRSLFSPAFIFAVSMFCRCFPLGFSRPLQPTPSHQPPVAYYQPDIRAQRNQGSPSNVQVIKKWRQKLQSFTQAQEEKLRLQTLQNNRAQYLSQKPDDDLYMFFLDSKRVKAEPFESPVSVERHHIIPRFEGGSDDSENILLLTPEDHILAHFLRYLEYGKNEDAIAVLFRCGYDEEGRRMNQKQSLDRMKEQKKGRWDSEAQSERGKKGGSLGGSANTQAQFEARQAVGRKHGQETGLANQSAPLKKLLQETLKWAHETRPNQTFVTVPCKSGKEIIEQLEKHIPGQIRNQTTFYKILNGERKGMYGWKLLDKEIRSEAEGGKGPSERSETST